MPEAKVQYIVELVKEGSGAQQASAELQGLQTQAAAVTAGATATTAQFGNLAQSTKTATSGIKALHGAAMLVGMQAFPQLSIACMTVTQGLRAVRASGMEVTAGIGLTTASVAGLVAGLISAVYWWRAYTAGKEEAADAKLLKEQTQDLGERLKEMLSGAREAGQITIMEFERLNKLAGTIAGNRTIQDFLRELEVGTAGGAEADLERRIELTNLMLGKMTDVKAQEAAINQDYKDRINLYEMLRQQGLITEDELMAKKDQAHIKQLQALRAIEKQTTDVDRLQKTAAQNFASGFSQAFVDFISGTKNAGQAFGEFAASFMQQIAQMIMQMLVMRAITSMFGAFGGGAAGGGGENFQLTNSFAARGGLFPNYMALGGVASVSQPTYFPRFNVVAGEAGREMLAVLARPRFLSIGGLETVVGNAGGNRLAITNADQLASRAGGMVEIRVTLSPELRAEIVNQSVAVAKVSVVQDMRQDTPISRGVKRLTA
jgi:uncharacterized phage infection (PIP) family protein YhgE